VVRQPNEVALQGRISLNSTLLDLDSETSGNPNHANCLSCFRSTLFLVGRKERNELQQSWTDKQFKPALLTAAEHDARPGASFL